MSFGNKVSRVAGKRFKMPKVDYGPSRTKQEFAKQADINNIMRRFEKTGQLTHVRTYQGMYGDVSTAGDYLAACQTVVDVTAMFNSLDSLIRKDFDNDPAKFLEAMANDTDGELRRKYKLAGDSPAGGAAVPDSGVPAPEPNPKPPQEAPVK